MQAFAHKEGNGTCTALKTGEVAAHDHAVNPLWSSLATRVSMADNVGLQRKPGGEEGQPPENQAPEDQSWWEPWVEKGQEWLKSWECDPAKNTPPRTPLAVNIPDIDCVPEPAALEDIVSDRRSAKQVLGITSVKTIAGFSYAPTSLLGFCSYNLSTAPALEFDRMQYTRANADGEAYSFGDEKADSGECAGKTIPLKIRITKPMAEKIRQGEVEHCKDYKLAFALSYGKYVQAFQEMVANGLCGSDCDAAMKQYFKARTGVEFDKMHDSANVLLAKTRLRDSSGWHSVNLYEGNREYGADCSSVTYTPDPNQMTNIGTMTPEELISGQK